MKFVLRFKSQPGMFLAAASRGKKQIPTTQEMYARQFTYSKAKAYCERFPEQFDIEPTMALPNVWNY